LRQLHAFPTRRSSDLPAFEGSRTDVQDAMRDSPRQAGGVRQRRMRQSFVIAEIALAVVLLVGAGLMLRSFMSLRRVDPGYSTTKDRKSTRLNSSHRTI